MQKIFTLERKRHSKDLLIPIYTKKYISTITQWKGIYSVIEGFLSSSCVLGSLVLQIGKIGVNIPTRRYCNRFVHYGTTVQLLEPKILT